jgi:hypothetical protein
MANSVKNIDDTLPDELRVVFKPQSASGASAAGGIEMAGPTGDGVERGEANEKLEERQMPDEKKPEAMMHGLAAPLVNIRDEVAAALASERARKDQDDAFNALKTENAALKTDLAAAKASTGTKDLEDKLAIMATERDSALTAKAEVEKSAASAKDQLAAAEKELGQLRVERAVARRRSELDASGVLVSDPARQAVQLSRAAAMDDATFQGYLEEIKSLKGPVDQGKASGEPAKTAVPPASAASGVPGVAGAEIVAQAIASMTAAPLKGAAAFKQI